MDCEDFEWTFWTIPKNAIGRYIWKTTAFFARRKVQESVREHPCSSSSLIRTSDAAYFVSRENFPFDAPPRLVLGTYTKTCWACQALCVFTPYLRLVGECFRFEFKFKTKYLTVQNVAERYYPFTRRKSATVAKHFSPRSRVLACLAITNK